MLNGRRCAGVQFLNHARLFNAEITPRAQWRWVGTALARAGTARHGDMQDSPRRCYVREICHSSTSSAAVRGKGGQTVRPRRQGTSLTRTHTNQSQTPHFSHFTLLHFSLAQYECWLPQTWATHREKTKCAGELGVANHVG